MAAYRLPAHVESRIRVVLNESERVFGAAARERYALLIEQAMQDVAMRRTDRRHGPLPMSMRAFSSTT